MGGIVSSVLSIKHTSKPNQNPQDDALSYKGKVGAMKLLINSDSSKAALLKYLTELNKDCILNWCIDLDEYKKTTTDNLLFKAIEIRNKYDPNFHIGSSSSAIADVWKSVDETLPKQKTQTLVDGIPAAIDDAEISKNIKIAQDFIYSSLANELDGFMQSSYYKEWDSVYGKDNEFQDVKKHSLMTSDIILEKTIKEKYLNVLIIDDSPVHSKYVAHVFESNGHRVRIANHGRVGVNIAISFNFAAIFVDMTIKTMDPIEILRFIREFEQAKNKVSNRNLISVNSKNLASGKTNKDPNLRKLSNASNPNISSAPSQPSTADDFTTVSMGNLPAVPALFFPPVKQVSKSVIVSPRAIQPMTTRRLLIALVLTNSGESPNSPRNGYDECITLTSSETTKGLEEAPMLPPIQAFYEIIQKREIPRNTK